MTNIVNTDQKPKRKPIIWYRVLTYRQTYELNCERLGLPPLKHNIEEIRDLREQRYKWLVKFQQKINRIIFLLQNYKKLTTQSQLSTISVWYKKFLFNYKRIYKHFLSHLQIKSVKTFKELWHECLSLLNFKLENNLSIDMAIIKSYIIEIMHCLHYLKISLRWTIIEFRTKKRHKYFMKSELYEAAKMDLLEYSY